MKGLFSSLGWIMFLALAVLVLLFYNISYLPKQERIVRLQQEISMWTQQITELTDSLQRLNSARDTTLNRTYRFDELFVSGESLILSVQGKLLLREVAPQLKALNVKFDVIGHTDGANPPINSPYRTNWEYTAAAAAAVANELVNLGVPAGLIMVCGAGDSRPLMKKGSADARLLNRRVEIAVRSQ